MQMGTEQLAAILYQWLTDTSDRVGDFLTTFDEFTVDSNETNGARDILKPEKPGKPNVFIYYGNDGKRNAVASFFQYILSSKEPGTVFLSTDESMQWLHENDAYLRHIRAMTKELVDRGFRILRVAEPLQSADQAFDSLSNWLPLYMTGQVESFYYPRMRDALYRRTLIVLAGVAAVGSTSIAGQTVNGVTFFTQDKRLANAYADEFRNILAKCRPMMTTYSTESGTDGLLRCIAKFDNDQGDSIQQSTTLSSLTVPHEVVEYAVSTSGDTDAEHILHALAMSRESLRMSLGEYEMIDIHSLATAEEVRGGSVPIGVGFLCKNSPVYYTPRTYAMHLQSIIDHMKEYSNYRAVLIPRSEDNRALFVKDNRHALLLRTGSPFTVFEAAQADIAAACNEYLCRRIESKLPIAKHRQETMARLEAMIHELNQS